jgi:hypothetical protein
MTTVHYNLAARSTQTRPWALLSEGRSASLMFSKEMDHTQRGRVACQRAFHIGGTDVHMIDRLDRLVEKQ